MSMFSALSREQKEAVGLLQIGTFLEYFDLMLYVHLAVLLDELFFPKTDPHTAGLISAFAFCSTFVVRPFGALIFGYIGDHIGRKNTVVITTTMMAISCVFMANLPTYAEIGISAAWIVTACRISQGLSSLGEIMGAEIYVSEITKPPVSYVAVSFISVASAIGAMAALGTAVIVTSFHFNWRIAFWVGALIAIVGSVARTRLRETPEFIDMKEKLKKALADAKSEGLEKHAELLTSMKALNYEKINKKNSLAYFMVYCGWPLTFYLAYMYFNPLLKSKFGYSAEDIIFHNFWLSLIQLTNCIVWSLMSYKIHPLKILKWRGSAALILMLILPLLMGHLDTSYQMFLVQSLIMILMLGGVPADAVFIKHFPVYRRFTTTSFLYALTRAVMYIITSFGLVYLGDFFGVYGLWVITLPAVLAFLWGVNHFTGLEIKNGSYDYRSQLKQKSKRVV
ncbi:MFS transporter [Candidatus Bealeia paramacronuclearis]|uniref:MFS transporter n=1 Tax=Candidatus Bealeia paramacronuclearis TaxID=1921001 RepID=A0ABZ2C417_9PROT|nr:MFS transporter [Candidatus Bealeia paramacronuclearis]